MDATERQIIDALFAKVRQAEEQTGPRDGAAEAHIRRLVETQPAAPYYMAQAIIMQEQALAAARARIEDLERQAEDRPTGGFLGALFGGGPAHPPAPRRGAATGIDPRISAYADPSNPRAAGGGFLAGAMQTAMGVAGGVVLGNMLASLFAADTAAAEPPPDEAPDDFDIGDVGGDDF
jgi:hypothetical protein